MAGMTQSQLCGLEYGKHKPNKGTLLKLAKALGEDFNKLQALLNLPADKDPHYYVSDDPYIGDEARTRGYVRTGVRT